MRNVLLIGSLALAILGGLWAPAAHAQVRPNAPTFYYVLRIVVLCDISANCNDHNSQLFNFQQSRCSYSCTWYTRAAVACWGQYSQLNEISNQYTYASVGVYCSTPTNYTPTDADMGSFLGAPHGNCYDAYPSGVNYICKQWANAIQIDHEVFEP